MEIVSVPGNLVLVVPKLTDEAKPTNLQCPRKQLKVPKGFFSNHLS
jgi:hypothetical protein